MSWDPRAERITARAAAAKAEAEAEAIRMRAATARETAQEDRREKRRGRRAGRWATRRGAAGAMLRRRAVQVVAIGSPEVIAWAGQWRFGRDVMRLGPLAPLLPVALEGGVLYAASLALQAVERDVPAGRYRATTWTLAGIAATLNLWHGVAAGGPQVGVALALTSLLGIVLLELTVSLKRHQAAHRAGAEIRQSLIRRLRYPRLSAQAAAIGAARGLDEAAAWRAAWIDRYGIGPDSTRRDRRTARVISARAQRADRKAARKGELLIEHGTIARPGTWVTDAALSAWIGPYDPPSPGLPPGVPAPRSGGPHGTAPASGDTPPHLEWNTPEQAAEHLAEQPPRGRPEDAHRDELQRLLEIGELPAHPSAAAIQRALTCRRETAIRLRDELAEGR